MKHPESNTGKKINRTIYNKKKHKTIYLWNPLKHIGRVMTKIRLNMMKVINLQISEATSTKTHEENHSKGQTQRLPPPIPAT
jgi:hypothetical protein